MSLAVDKAAEVENHALGFVALAEDGGVGVLESRELFYVALAFAFELFSDFLLQHERFQGIISMLFRSREANGETGSVVLLLLDKGVETAIFALVGFDLDFEVLSFFGKLLGKGLEFEELKDHLVYEMLWVDEKG